MKEIDRIGDWKEFSEYMAEQYLQEMVDEYGGREGAPDLMVFANRMICVWNILKYALRLWNGKGKPKDLEKITYCAQIAWTMGGGTYAVTQSIKANG